MKAYNDSTEERRWLRENAARMTLSVLHLTLRPLRVVRYKWSRIVITQYDTVKWTHNLCRCGKKATWA